MRGTDQRSGSLFSYVDIEARVPKEHPLRGVRELVNGALSKLDKRFGELYSKDGRPSIAPERLLRASLLQLFYSIRSERQLMERMDFDLLFRWFVGLGIDDPVWDHSVFSKNRDRLLNTEITQDFLAALLSEPKVKRLLSHEHFSVDGTLLDAWASMKSFRPNDGSGDPPDGGRNREQNFRGEKRSNETHESTTDPDARLYRKSDGRESRLCYMAHAIMENRNGLAICGEVTHAMQALKQRNVTPHVAINGTISRNGISRKTAVDRRTARHPGYPISQCIRKLEEIFGWVKSIGGLDQLKVRGIEKARTAFILALAAYDLIRLPKLLGVPP
jgi:transposase